MQALCVLNSTRDASEALGCKINISSPNVKVIYQIYIIEFDEFNVQITWSFSYRLLYVQVSRLLLLSGASPDTIVDQATKESLMSRFASKGNVEMVRMLSVEFGGNVNISDLQVRKTIYFAPYTNSRCRIGVNL